MPIINNLFWGGLSYIDCGTKEEPSIENDRINMSATLWLSKKASPDNFQMKLFPLDNPEEEITITAVNADAKAQLSQKENGKFLRFYLHELNCKTTYQYQIFYKNKTVALGINIEPMILRTPPARQDPQPIKIAVGGDQERLEQLGLLGRLFHLDNSKHTKKLYQHIFNTGNPQAKATDDIEEQCYELFFHLSDLFNGEFSFFPMNIFEPGRHIFERNVTSRDAFRYHLKKDFGKVVKNALANVNYGFYAAADDHDTGQNNGKAPQSDKQTQVRQYMAESFHEAGLMPDFLTMTSDGYGPVITEKGREGPYYKKRFGQTEFYILHNRYTQNPGSEDSYLLGNEQWYWLEQSLQNSTASHKVIVSPLPFVMGKKPAEDYRGHWQEWHRFMQLCRQYKISTILAADSHNYSYSEIHVRENEQDTPWVVHHHLVGTLGGSSQSITAEEKEEINKAGRPPLLPQGDGFNHYLYEGSKVRAYFSPGEKTALLPIQEDESADSEWTKDWSKNTHAYAGLTCTPQIEQNSKDEFELLPPEEELYSAAPAMPWQVKSCLFTCSRKRKVDHDKRFDMHYLA